MESLGKASSTTESSQEPVALDRLTLRFQDPQLESAFRADYFRHNLGNLRLAFLGGVVLWVAFGLILYGQMLALADKRVDLAMRYGVFIPLLLVGFGLSFTRFFERIWEWVSWRLSTWRPSECSGAWLRTAWSGSTDSCSSGGASWTRSGGARTASC